MKKIFLLLSVSALLLSCNEEPKSKREELVENAANIEEKGAYTDIQFNDGLLAEIILLDLRYEELADMEPNEDASNSKEFATESVRIADETINNIKEIQGIGKGAEALKQTGMNVATAFRQFMESFSAATDFLVLPEDDWTEEDINSWNTLVEEPNTAYLEAYDNYVQEQDVFFTANNISVRETVTASDIYEQEKNTK